METLLHFLKTEFNIHSDLIPYLLHFYKHTKISKGDFLLKQGEQCHKMYLIDKGYVRFFNYDDEKTITHWIFGAQHFITDVGSFFLKRNAKWNIQAITDTEVFILNKEDYTTIRERYPSWDSYEKLFLIKLMAALENRVYTLVSMSSEERYQYLFNHDPEMFNTIPLQYLASMLGMTPETLSRIRKKMSS